MDKLINFFPGVEVISELDEKAEEVRVSLTLFYEKIENGSFTVSVGGIEYQAINQTVIPAITCQSAGYVWIDYYCGK